MQDESTCRQCGAKFDRALGYNGEPKTRGRKRHHCSQACRVAYRDAHRGTIPTGRAWPRSEAIERDVCAEYLSGVSRYTIGEKYGVSEMTIYGVLKRNNVTMRSRNASTLRKRRKGGRIVDQYGYVGVMIDPTDPFFTSMTSRITGKVSSTGAKYVAEHRLVMTRALGRPLKPTETVHHKNGVRTDNRLENLEVWVARHGAGQRVQDLIGHVVENYPDAVRAALDGEHLTTDLL